MMTTTMGPSRLNICMISDFFYPNMGGVENHLFNLSQCLICRGHKVIIMTHAYGDRTGVRWLARGLKVYHLPVPEMYSQCTLPTLFSLLPLMRSVFIRERINHVHGHQAFSSMCHEGIFHAQAMGIPCTFTDHSLFGFADTSSILTNKLLKFTLSNVEQVICVSNTSKENTVLRAALDPEKVFVVPNAVISQHFRPDPSKRNPEYVTVVVLSRLVYRKGVDLLVAVVPRICSKFPNVRFLIAGDGPKKVDLEQMRDEHLLHDRVEMIGSVPSEEARNVMVRGEIFLNTSLTEAFCMAIVEAASCGLLVVSTKVGGVPEVLPQHMIILAQPDEDHLTMKLTEAIELVSTKKLDTTTFHAEVAKMYSWPDVAERTERIYLQNRHAAEEYSLPLRMSTYYGCGEFFGKVACFLLVINYLLLKLLDWLVPPSTIDIAPDFELDDYEGLLAHFFYQQQQQHLELQNSF